MALLEALEAVWVLEALVALVVLAEKSTAPTAAVCESAGGAISLGSNEGAAGIFSEIFEKGPRISSALAFPKIEFASGINEKAQAPATMHVMPILMPSVIICLVASDFFLILLRSLKNILG